MVSNVELRLSASCVCCRRTSSVKFSSVTNIGLNASLSASEYPISFQSSVSKKVHQDFKNRLY